MAARARAGDRAAASWRRPSAGEPEHHRSRGWLRFPSRPLADARRRIATCGPSPRQQPADAYRILSVAGLRHAIDLRSLGYAGRTEAASGRMLFLSRIAVAAAALCVGVGLVAVGYKASRPAARPVEASVPGAERLAPAMPATAEPDPAPYAGLPAQAPAGVWLVEKGEGYEQYSNGLRIETGFAVTGPARRYRVFESDGRFGEAVYAAPAGILFHTTESDVWPLEASFNENLRDSSHRLLRYVSRNRLTLPDRPVRRVPGWRGRQSQPAPTLGGRRRARPPEPQQRVLQRGLRDAVGRRPGPPPPRPSSVQAAPTEYLRQRYGGSPPEMPTTAQPVNPRTLTARAPHGLGARVPRAGLPSVWPARAERPDSAPATRGVPEGGRGPGPASARPSRALRMKASRRGTRWTRSGASGRMYDRPGRSDGDTGAWLARRGARRVQPLAEANDGGRAQGPHLEVRKRTADGGPFSGANPVADGARASWLPTRRARGMETATQPPAFIPSPTRLHREHPRPERHPTTARATVPSSTAWLAGASASISTPTSAGPWRTAS
jgi:hypothetical protein